MVRRISRGALEQGISRDRTFEQIVSARRSNNVAGEAHQALVANLARKYFHDRLSMIADAMKSENPEQAKTEGEALLVGMVSSSMV